MVPITPDPKMTNIGFTLNFLRAINPAENNANSTILKLDNIMSCFSAWNKARVNIDNPAELIRATTAGRRLANIVCTPPKLRYL